MLRSLSMSPLQEHLVNGILKDRDTVPGTVPVKPFQYVPGELGLIAVKPEFDSPSGFPVQPKDLTPGMFLAKAFDLIDIKDKEAPWKPAEHPGKSFDLFSKVSTVVEPQYVQKRVH